STHVCTLCSVCSSRSLILFLSLFFFFNSTAPIEIYTLSLHDALPISTARVASIMENTNLSKQQQVSEIMRQMLTQAQTAGKIGEIGRAVQQECRDRSRMPSSA